ncbi:TetR/AcrR family transcriptional regulator [Amycolatopsis sp. K13G38]|uniref:TetR/AcrR family transcriptional regulator n=1 Tax=Amycolatopsis acididurans TaxID=2724524 RepID=A0ABX1JBY4_9PSEU|nr:TetR/AcrR family transcriptional regulator [Amycolatopsis acididurans]NKQ56989.1 TetR/AcrR family transcriptional regulator [Amycolatopsis acididurans]
MTDSFDSAPARSRGRPRDPAISVAVLEATIKVLARDGVDRMSMEAVAAEAGVSKVTLYARFRNKTGLIGAALAHLRVDHVPARTGDTRADLVALLKAMRRQYDEVGGMSIIGSCLVSDGRSGALLDVIREATLRPRRGYFLEVLAAARDRGEIRPQADLELAVSQLVGAFYADQLAGREMAEDWDARVVDTVLDGIARP